jgi:hypothetical protein
MSLFVDLALKLANLHGIPVGSQIQERAGDNIQAAITVEVTDSARFAAEVADPVFTKLDLAPKHLLAKACNTDKE